MIYLIRYKLEYINISTSFEMTGRMKTSQIQRCASYANSDSNLVFSIARFTFAHEKHNQL